MVLSTIHLVHLNESGIADYTATTSGKTSDFDDNPSFIPFDTYEKAQAVLGKRYTDGQWQDIPKDPTPPDPTPPELSQTEKDLLAIMEGVAATYERQEKTGLDIMEGIAGLYEATLSGGTQK